MEPNPYQPPGPLIETNDPKEPDRAVRLLAEIRDMEREILELARINEKRTQFIFFAALLLMGVCAFVVISGFVVWRILPNS